MKVTLDNLQDIGEGIQDEFNSLINIIDHNIVERKLKVGSKEVLTNNPIQNLESFREIIDRASSIGCSVSFLKTEQLLNLNKITIIECQIGCYRSLLRNLKLLRLHLYVKREDISKNIHITGELRFDRTQAEQYITKYIQKLYMKIAELRKELWDMREGEIIEFDESLIEKNRILIEEDEQLISKNEEKIIE